MGSIGPKSDANRRVDLGSRDATLFRTQVTGGEMIKQSGVIKTITQRDLEGEQCDASAFIHEYSSSISQY